MVLEIQQGDSVILSQFFEFLWKVVLTVWQRNIKVSLGPKRPTRSSGRVNLFGILVLSRFAWRRDTASMIFLTFFSYYFLVLRYFNPLRVINYFIYEANTLNCLLNFSKNDPRANIFTTTED